MKSSTWKHFGAPGKTFYIWFWLLRSHGDRSTDTNTGRSWKQEQLNKTKLRISRHRHMHSRIRFSLALVEWHHHSSFIAAFRRPCINHISQHHEGSRSVWSPWLIHSFAWVTKMEGQGPITERDRRGKEKCVLMAVPHAELFVENPRGGRQKSCRKGRNFCAPSQRKERKKEQQDLSFFSYSNPTS